MLLMAIAPAFGQNSNDILTVTPVSAAQGTVALPVMFALDTDVPPAPPAGVMPTSVTIGTNAGASVTHSTQYEVTALFAIPASEPVGFKDATVVFSTPNGTLTFSKADAFQVTAGSGVIAGFTATPRSGPVPLIVSFTDNSMGEITNQLWDFGDGTTNSATSPSHTYTNTGTFTVSLTVYGADGSNTLTRPGWITVSALPPPGAYPVVDTRQTNCYNHTTVMPTPAAGQPFFGQDAQHAGSQPHYIDNGDGTVTDLVTGLMWQQDPGDKVTFNAATNGAGALTLGGYSDWRVPTIKELYSLILFNGLDASPCMGPGGGTCNAMPFLDTNYFRFQYGNTNVGERIIDAQYWSGTEYVSTTMGGNATVFGVNFADGRIKGYPRDTGPSGPFTEFCRYVRGNPDFGINRFVDHGDGTITDEATWLMWSQEDSATGLNWSNALAWVQSKNAADYLGYSDWRLPNAKELQTLVDYTRSPDTTASAAVFPLFHCSALLNESGQPDWPAYWTGTTHVDANGSGAWAVYVCFGRAMGYMNSTWMDVHGAGAQRSDPKDGSASDYPAGHGPQGDSVRVTNFVRLVRTTTANEDTVGDGIPNAWRQKFFGSAATTNSVSCATCDPDADGASNHDEYVADTNPANALSRFCLQAVSTMPEITLSYPSSSNRLYTLLYCTNLVSGTWTNLPSQTDIRGSGGVDTVVDYSPAIPYRFYRLRVRLP